MLDKSDDDINKYIANYKKDLTKDKSYNIFQEDIEEDKRKKAILEQQIDNVKKGDPENLNPLYIWHNPKEIGIEKNRIAVFVLYSMANKESAEEAQGLVNALLSPPILDGKTYISV